MNKKYIWAICVAVVVLAVAVFAYNGKGKDTATPSPAQTTPVAPTPFIKTISPSSAKLGTTLTISGTNLSGFEGDLYFFFERTDGKVSRLKGTMASQMAGSPTAAQTVLVILKEPCQAGETVYGDYSGQPSPCNYVKLSPGSYKIYTKPWDNMSNKVSFTITSN